MDWPNNAVVPTFINSFSRWMQNEGYSNSAGVTTIGSAAWATMNSAIYIPLILPWPYTVRRAFWFNGSSAGGNCDIGIYTAGGARLWSAGSTAGSGNSAPQYVTPSTVFVLSPGLYYLGFAADNTTANRLYLAAYRSELGQTIGAYEQATAFALPASAAFATNAAQLWPLIGITNTSSGY